MTDIYETFNAVVHNPHNLVALDSLRLSLAATIAAPSLAGPRDPHVGPAAWAVQVVKGSFAIADLMLAEVGVHDPRKEEA